MSMMQTFALNMRFVGTPQRALAQRERLRWRWRGPGVPRDGVLWGVGPQVARVNPEFDRGSG